MAKDAERYDQVIRLLAHDVRNPLTAVQLNAQIIEQAAARDGRAKDQRMASRIASAARRLDTMLQQLVEAERIRSGHVALALQSVDIGHLLRDLLAKQNPAFDPSRVRVTSPEAPLAVSADPNRLGQALVHLLCLALQHAGGSALVHVELKGRDDSVACVLRVPGQADTKAFRSPASDAGEPVRPQPSDGMTLHLARTMVECHGGHLLVSEDETLGEARFEIVLPAG